MSKFLTGAAAIALLVGISAANAQQGGTATQSEIDNAKGAPKTQNNTATGGPAKDVGKTTGSVNSNEAPPSGTAQTPYGAMNNPPAGISRATPGAN